MVREADYVFCIWNGLSMGTKAAYDYARMFKKKTARLKVLRPAYLH